MNNIIKISYFPKDATKEKVISYNGLALDNYCISAKTKENIENATYILDAEFVFNEDINNYLQEEAILKVALDYGEEIFRIIKVNKTTRRIIIVANQITITECKQLYLKDVRPTQVNGLGALNHMLTGATGRKDIYFSSDISIVNSANYQKKSLQEAIYGADNSFISKWGGETLRRGYNITINKKIGAERGVSIREAKNLIGFEVSTNLENLCTRAVGQGYNGLMGNYIDSPLINRYSDIYTKVIQYPNVKVAGAGTEKDEGSIYFNTEKEAIAYLDSLVKKEFEENNIDKIKATYTINFAQLEKFEEYKDYIQAERIFLGDTIRVYIPKIQTDIKVRAIEKTYDIMAQKTEEIVVSNASLITTISNSSILNSIKNMLNENSSLDLKQYIDATIKAGMKGSYVVVRDGELLAMNSKDINSATIVTRLNKNGLGFSDTGYYGTYKYGFTLDGKINASLISTGILSTILIQNADGSFQIDLSGTGGASFYNNNKIAMRIQNNSLMFYDWKNGGYIGSIQSTRSKKKDTPSITFCNDEVSATTIGYEKDGSIYPYMRFDKYKHEDDISTAIKSYEDIGLVNYKDLVMYGNDYARPLGLLAIATGNNNMYICCGAEADNRKVNIGCIGDDDMQSLKAWATFSKDDIRLAKELYITTTWQGNAGIFRLSNILDAINTRLTNLENK